MKRFWMELSSSRPYILEIMQQPSYANINVSSLKFPYYNEKYWFSKFLKYNFETKVMF